MEHRFIAMLALKQAATVTPEQLVSQIGKQFPDLATQIEPIIGKDAAEQAGSAFLLKAGTSMLSVMFLDQPLPPGTLDKAIAADRIWPEAKTRLSEHRAHIIVGGVSTFSTFPDALEQAKQVTLVSAALSRLTPTIGVYWAQGDTVSEVNRFRQGAENLLKGHFPLDAWVQLWWLDGLPAEQGARTLAVITTGMLPFIGREIEFEPAAMPPLTIAERVIGTMQYLLTQGPVIKDNETLGISEQERIRVRHLTQGQRPEVPVLSLRVEGNLNGLGE